MEERTDIQNSGNPPERKAEKNEKKFVRAFGT